MRIEISIYQSDKALSSKSSLKTWKWKCVVTTSAKEDDYMNIKINFKIIKK